MKNQQRPKPPLVSDGNTIDVHSIFHTIQGEGPFAGQPAVFLRLQDCNLQCPLCDTEYTGGFTEHVDRIVDLVNKCGDLPPHKEHISLVVITGGEPFRQNLGLLLLELVAAGHHPQIETNGMLPVQAFPVIKRLVSRGQTTIVVSPKTHKLHDDVAVLAGAFKYVIKAGHVHDDGLPISALNHPLPKGKTIARPPAGFDGDIFIQPVDEKDARLNKMNMTAAAAATMTFPGKRRLCLQMHKYAELP